MTSTGPDVPDSKRVADGIKIDDSLQNVITGLGTSRDKSTGAAFVFSPVTREQLDISYRSDWISRKIVDIPALDATREWRTWQSTKDDIGDIEDLEDQLDIRSKVQLAMIKARLYGGAALLMGVDQGVINKPLIPELVGEGDLKFVHVVSRYELNAGPIVWDIDDPLYGQPEYYTRTRGDMTQVHPSRVVRFLGAPVPDLNTNTNDGGWGDSILQIVHDAIIAANIVTATGAQLVQEAKLDVIKIPGLTSSLQNKEYAERLRARFSLANMAKSVYSILLLDAAEDWQRIAENFRQIPEMLQMYLLIASGAADIPATRMLGQSPAGMSATGDSDTRNYYDRVTSEQNTVLTPAMATLDEILVRSAGVDYDPKIITYEWNSLWQMTETEQAAVAASKATTFTADVNAGLIPPEVLRDARINQLIEDGTYPGIEQILDDYGPLEDIAETPEPGSIIGPDGTPLPPTDIRHPANQPPAAANANDPSAKGASPAVVPKKSAVGDMARRLRMADTRSARVRHADGTPRTLYVYRRVTNAADIAKWAISNGFKDVTNPSDMHVTVMYSRTPVQWTKVGDDWCSGSNDDGGMTVKPGGMRDVQKFGNALVLCFSSSNLSWRHEGMKSGAGCTWEYEDYVPHITLTYNTERAPDYEDEVVPYQGKIELGPEVFEQVKSSAEIGDENPNHDPASGQFSSGEGGTGALGHPLSHVAPSMQFGDPRKVLGAVSVEAHRVGDLKDPGWGIHFGDTHDSVAQYASLDAHAGKSVQQYRVDAQNAVAFHSQMDAYPQLFKGKSYNDAIYAASKKGTVSNPARIVEKRISGELRRLGHDAIIYTSPPAPANHELVVIGKTATVTNVHKRAGDAALRDYNENHDPASGQFSGGEGGSGLSRATKLSLKQRAHAFVTSEAAKHVMNTVVSKAKDPEIHKELLSRAVVAGMYHLASMDMGPDLEEAVRHEVAGLAHTTAMTVAAARSHVRSAVEKLAATRIGARVAASKTVAGMAAFARADAAIDDIHELLQRFLDILDNDALFKQGDEGAGNPADNDGDE